MHTKNGHCFLLNQFLFTSASKPWYGIIHVALFVPNYLLQIKELGFRAFKYDLDFHFKASDHVVFNSLPTINVLISNDTQPRHPNNHLFQWMAMSTSRSLMFLPLTVNDIFLHVILANRLTVAVTKICGCSTLITRHHLAINSFTTLDNTGVLRLAYLDFQFCLDKISCGINQVKTELHRRVLQNQKNCKFSHGSIWDPTYTSQSNGALALTMLALLPNETRKFFDSCKTGLFDHTDDSTAYKSNGLLHRIIPSIRIDSTGVMEPEPAPNISENTLNIQHAFGSLRFVACGQRGTDWFKFHEFVNAYDKFVRTIFMVAFLLLSTVLILLQTKCQYGKKIGSSWLQQILKSSMPILKGALEQGDPFCANFLKTTKLRWLVATYLLAVLVLSNGYKNTNVYNMITSRKTLLIETLDDVKS